MKYVCYTLDLEPDFGGRLKSHSSLDNMSYFDSVVAKNKLQLTTFATGYFFETQKRQIKHFENLGSDIQLHSFSHNTNNPNHTLEITKGKKAYKKYFGKDPQGYRAPQGILSQKGFAVLSKEGFLYDSSIYPTTVPGRYNNWRFPTQPFFYKKHGLIELPMSVTHGVRLPLAMGYVQPLGFPVSRLVSNIFGVPEIVIFDFHMWNLYKPVGTNTLSKKAKLLFARNLDKGFEIFEGFIGYFKKKGYTSINMRDLYELMKKKHEQNELQVYS